MNDFLRFWNGIPFPFKTFLSLLLASAFVYLVNWCTFLWYLHVSAWLYFRLMISMRRHDKSMLKLFRTNALNPFKQRQLYDDLLRSDVLNNVPHGLELKQHAFSTNHQLWHFFKLSMWAWSICAISMLGFVVSICISQLL